MCEEGQGDSIVIRELHGIQQSVTCIAYGFLRHLKRNDESGSGAVYYKRTGRCKDLPNEKVGLNHYPISLQNRVPSPGNHPTHPAQTSPHRHLHTAHSIGHRRSQYYILSFGE